MSEPLTPDRVAALLPALGPLAEATAQRGALDPADLSLLQMGLGLDEPWAADEMRRWADILGAARQPGRQDMAARALTLRGVPEDDATRAVAAAAGVAAAPAAAATTTTPWAIAVWMVELSTCEPQSVPRLRLMISAPCCTAYSMA